MLICIINLNNKIMTITIDKKLTFTEIKKSNIKSVVI